MVGGRHLFWARFMSAAGPPGVLQPGRIVSPARFKDTDSQATSMARMHRDHALERLGPRRIGAGNAAPPPPAKLNAVQT